MQNFPKKVMADFEVFIFEGPLSYHKYVGEINILIVSFKFNYHSVIFKYNQINKSKIKK